MVGRACVAGRPGHVWQGVWVAGTCVAAETATAAGGADPTGMHSCLSFFPSMCVFLNFN